MDSAMIWGLEKGQRWLLRSAVWERLEMSLDMFQ
jgi:hypothetical protein